MRLELRNGNFGYTQERLLLRDISFALEQGRIMTILGQNGIGKTTLLKCLIGLLKWQKGQTLVDGKPLHSLKECEAIGYVPQAHRSVFAFTVAEMTAMGRARHVPLFGTPSQWDRQRVEKALQIVGIEGLKDRLCTQLSGGQLQLVYIARALVNEPQLLIMDEPESHLDYKNQQLILNLVRKLRDEKGISCIINTHYPDHALRISDDTLMLGQDRYLFGPSEEIITEATMKEFFEVNVKILSVPGLQKKSKAFAVVD
ncbi:ABC transporter ATP-binding protein [Desulfitobacterium chlororespirans]|uniref:Iron complex transport system ATP-binding protein n=1 Tax=Desulfitobacterium chlororespirans DSM 11544 TaxID=1121395 RepID=A0A1M7RV30_9FIRM|nr:ABC transporter ATP-binding protein [Desulfitobacterium chlororespirans]SHN50060.1 iron complex transport system ATP-binding protein [Desulfitobacterium chlororespirans DSM 11544]